MLQDAHFSDLSEIGRKYLSSYAAEEDAGLLRALLFAALKLANLKPRIQTFGRD